MAIKIGKKNNNNSSSGNSLIGGLFSRGQNAVKSAEKGAVMGSAIPGVGTKAGAVIGGVGGFLGIFGSKKK